MCHMQGRLTQSNVVEFSFKDLSRKCLQHITHKNHVTSEENSWQRRHCFMPSQVRSCIHPNSSTTSIQTQRMGRGWKGA